MYRHGSDIPVINTEIDSNELYLIGDLHIDARTFKEEIFRKALKIIGDAPVILLGDVLDYGFFDDLLGQERKRMKEDFKTRAMVQAMLKVDEIFDSFSHILAVCEGNHDVRVAKRTGEGVFLEYICARRNIPYIIGQGLLNVRVGEKQNKKPRYFRILITHGSRGGRRLSASVNELEDLAKIWSGIDVLVIGHHHQFAHVSPKKSVYLPQTGEIVTEVIEAISTPAFLGYEDYAQKRGYYPPEHALVKLLFDSKKGEVKVEKISL